MRKSNNLPEPNELDLSSKEKFKLTIKAVMQSMGLDILSSGVDYNCPLPELVAVYTEKNKYYMIEPISLECLKKDSARLTRQDNYKHIRKYCQKLFSKDYPKAAIVATILCELSCALEIFTYKMVGKHQLISMSKYACIAVPLQFEPAAREALAYLKLDFRTLDILDTFTLILLDKTQIAKLPEINKFITFILGNQ